MADRTNFRLNDIIDAIDQIHALLKNKTYKDLTTDKVVKAAFERFLEILSEASRHIPDSLSKMGIWFRVIFLGLLAFGLAGCNLETKKPLFADADAKLLLADYPNLAPYERDGGGWKKSAEPLSIKPEASHYLVKSGNSDMVITFVPLEGPWWILQAAETTGTSSYVLVMAEPKELLIYSLECKRLQESGKFGDEIEFKDSSCFITEDADKMGLFKALIGSASEPSTKLVSEP